MTTDHLPVYGLSVRALRARMRAMTRQLRGPAARTPRPVEARRDH
ncbi:hypothetical protein [Streptomyces bambusae]|nr:hypothetical protein [Streptomyces bambusae]